MSTEQSDKVTKKQSDKDQKSYETKKTEPHKKAHRAALNLTSNPKKTEKIVAGARNRYIKLLKAQKAFNDYIQKQVIEGIMDKYNEKVRPDQQIDTIQLYDHTGNYKLNLERQINRHLDGRADMAKQLVEEYIQDVENNVIELDPDSQMVYNLLRSMFFSKRGGFKMSPQMWQFILMDEKDIHDKRLKEAHKLLRESIHVDRSNWYAHVFVYKEDQNGLGSYEKLSIDDIEDIKPAKKEPVRRDRDDRKRDPNRKWA